MQTDRFWSKVDATGDCWEWTAALTAGGGWRKSGDGRYCRACIRESSKRKRDRIRQARDQSGDSAELTAIEDDWPVVDRLNPGRSASYA